MTTPVKMSSPAECTCPADRMPFGRCCKAPAVDHEARIAVLEEALRVVLNTLESENEAIVDVLWAEGPMHETLWEHCHGALYPDGREPPEQLPLAGVTKQSQASTTEESLAVQPAQVEALAHRIAWRYKKSSDPHHSDTYTFNRETLLQFAAAMAQQEQQG